MKLLYPHKISLDAKPRAGKKYSFFFSWRTTEDLSPSLVAMALDVVIDHFRAKYRLQQLEIHGLTPLLTSLTIAFVLKEDSDLMLGQIWEETRTFALERYLDLTLKEAMIWKARFPWWVLLVIAGEVGVIGMVAGKK